MRRTWTFADSEATQAFGRQLGERAGPGAVLALTGDLGAGKTCLAQGVGMGLGVRGPVTSPTFALIWVHESGRIPFVHADFYRLGDASECQELGLEELLGGEGVAVVEWADRFPEHLPEDRLNGTLEIPRVGVRTLTLEAAGPQAIRWLSGLD